MEEEEAVSQRKGQSEVTNSEMIKWFKKLFGYSEDQSLKWLYLTLMVTMIIAIPVIVLLTYLFIPSGQAWQPGARLMMSGATAFAPRYLSARTTNRPASASCALRCAWPAVNSV
jgi:hypothetical protein